MTPLTERADCVLARALELAPRMTSWADFSNALFNQRSGLLATTFPSREERQAFLETDQYQKINQTLLGLMHKFGLTEGAIPNRKCPTCGEAKLQARKGTRLFRGIRISNCEWLECPLCFEEVHHATEVRRQENVWKEQWEHLN